MRKDYRIWDKLAGDSDLFMEPLPAQPLVEIIGHHRVLIENHIGVMAYSGEKIAVRVNYGTICICGRNMEILRMTGEQLVIRGTINGISLMRKDEK